MAEDKWWSADTVAVVTGGGRHAPLTMHRALLSACAAPPHLTFLISPLPSRCPSAANKGIGYEVARQLAQAGLTVIATARDGAHQACIVV